MGSWPHVFANTGIGILKKVLNIFFPVLRTFFFFFLFSYLTYCFSVFEKVAIWHICFLNNSIFTRW